MSRWFYIRKIVSWVVISRISYTLQVWQLALCLPQPQMFFFFFFLGDVDKRQRIKLHNVKKWYRTLDTSALCILSHLNHQSWNSFSKFDMHLFEQNPHFWNFRLICSACWQAGFGMDNALSCNSKIFFNFFPFKVVGECWRSHQPIKLTHLLDLQWHTQKKNHFLFVVAFVTFHIIFIPWLFIFQSYQFDPDVCARLQNITQHGVI